MVAGVYPKTTGTLFDLAEELLTKLPPSAGEIAKVLQDAGVRGVRDSLCACPLARWLRTMLEVPVVLVDHSGIKIFDEVGNKYILAVPTGVHAFVDCFDADELFPELVDPKGPTREEIWGAV